MVILNAYLINKETLHLLQLRVMEARTEAVRLAKLLTEEEVSQLSPLDQCSVRKLIKPKTPRVKSPRINKTAPSDLPWS